jgi:integrase
VGIVKRSGHFYWVKRIPKRYAGLVLGADGKPVQQVRQSLHTESRSEALAKAAQVEAEKLAEWDALLAGDRGSARAHYEAARKLAEARGFSYRPIADLTTGDLAEILERIKSLGPPEDPASDAVVQAVLGTVPVVYPDLDGAFAEYLEFTRDRHLQKSDPQKVKWKRPRESAIRNFQTVVYDPRPCPPVDQITRADALTFRDWWSRRVEGGLSSNSANKQFNQLKEIFSTWAALAAPGLENPFAGLALKKSESKRTPPFSRSWIADRLLAPDSLARLNAEAADVLLILINTGLRPSEVTDAPLDDFRVLENIPYLRVAPHGRELKVAHTRRDVPLLGVSLEAARRIAARGGIKRYKNKANYWSALVNKYLGNNGLKETPSHTAYSIRHYVEDALLAAGVDDRVRADILGHKYHRPIYGEGGGLAGRRDALSKISL